MTLNAISFSSDAQSYTPTGGTITLAGTNAGIGLSSLTATQTIMNNIASTAGIPGQAQVLLNGGATSSLVLGGTNTYNGDTEIQNGTLVLKGSGSIANSYVNIACDCLLDVSQVTTGSTAIGGLQVGANSVDPATVNVNLGANTLRIGAVAGGPDGFNEINGVIGGTTGGVIFAGDTVVSNTQAYTGATRITANASVIIESFNGGSFGGSLANSSHVTVDAGSNLQFVNVDFDMTGLIRGPAIIYSLQSLDGAGSVFQDNNTLVLTNASGTFSGVIGVNNVNLAPSGPSPAIGGLTIAGGKEILSGNNIYTGATTINAGATLQLGDGGSSGSVAGIIVNDGTLQINRNDVFTLSNAISGGGALQQNGTGVTVVTAVNSYTGATAVNAGILDVEDSIASSPLTTVNAGSALIGTGTVGNTAVNGGILAPGSPLSNVFALLTVQGTLSFTAASTYMIQVSPATSGLTNVTGTATLNGASAKANFLPGVYVSKQYTILSATGGVLGTFSSLATTNIPAAFKEALSYDAHDVFLNLVLDFSAIPGLNQNQRNVGNALGSFFNANGSIPLVFGGLTPGGLTQVSGELATGSQQTTFDAMNLFIGLLTDPFVAGRGDGVTLSPTGAPQFADEHGYGVSAYAGADKPRSRSERDAYAAIYGKAPPKAVDSFVQRWSVWAAGYGGSQTTDGNAALGSNGATSRIAGTAVGADYRFSPNTLAGFAIAGGGTNFSLANGLGSGRSDLFQAGAFLRHTVGQAYISAALAYGWQDVTTDRDIMVAGLNHLRADFNANAFSGRLEGGYRYLTPWMGITPYAAGQFTTFNLPAYAEQATTGPNTFALSYADKDVTASRTELGLRTDKSYAMLDGILTLRGRVAWAHDFNPDRNIGATFQTLPGASFTVNGAQQAANSALVTGSAEMKWLSGFALAATFEGEFSNVTTSYAGKGVVRYSW